MISHDFASSRLTFTDATVCWGGPFCALAEASLGNLVGFYEEGVSWLKTGDGKNGLSVNRVVNLLTMWRWLFTAHVWQNLMNDSFILRSCAVRYLLRSSPQHWLLGPTLAGCLPLMGPWNPERKDMAWKILEIWSSARWFYLICSVPPVTFWVFCTNEQGASHQAAASHLLSEPLLLFLHQELVMNQRRIILRYLRPSGTVQLGCGRSRMLGKKHVLSLGSVRSMATHLLGSMWLAAWWIPEDSRAYLILMRGR